METVLGILLEIAFSICVLGVWYVVLKLLLRFPGLNDSLGKPVIKVYYKK